MAKQKAVIANQLRKGTVQLKVLQWKNKHKVVIGVFSLIRCCVFANIVLFFYLCLFVVLSHFWLCIYLL